MAHNKKQKCFKCGEEKVLLNFHKNSRNTNGYKGTCKTCCKILAHQRYLNNKEKIKAQVKTWAQNNKDKINKSHRIRYWRDHEKQLERGRKYSKNNPEKIKIAKHTHYIKNKRKILKYRKEWRENNQDKIRKYSKKHNPKRRARKVGVNENFLQEHIPIVFEAFSNKCVKCSTTDNLCIDHFRPLSRGFPLSLDNATILCNTCNCSKHNKDPEDFFTKTELLKISRLMNKAKKLAQKAA